ncbi:MAG: cupredoxin domain-containing protein [Candidatus Moraniibacteriota bacterium]
MQKAVLIFVIVVAAVGGYALYNKGGNAPASTANQKMADSATTKTAGSVKEFSTTAYYDETGVWYSLKEIRVKKGDTVRIKATNIKGMHDLVIDEYSIKQELPMNQEMTIEFTADKVGQFVFYCSKPGHREKGQWGTLIVE